jgi:hypothetical protein
MEDMRLKLLLPYTDAVNKVITERREKEKEIWCDFYATEAMINRKWTLPNYELRHVATRMAVHGFHHKVCQTKGFHLPSENCRCKLCYLECERYHITDCKRRSKSLTAYAEES